MKAPCKNCDKRLIGCHASCTDYADYRSEMDRKKQERHLAAKTEIAIRDFNRENFRRYDGHLPKR